MATVTLLKSNQVCCTEDGPSSTSECVWERDLLFREQAEALDFRRVQALQKHTEGLWGTLGVDVLQLTVYYTSFYIFTCIPKHFFSKSADPDSGDRKPFPAVCFSS